MVDHDPYWADRFAEIEDRLRADLGPGWKFEHVGSTSVPGLCAKPVIDIAVSVPTDADDGRVGLRSHDDDRDAYASLKSGLVGSGVWGSEYTKAKREFVTEIVNRARAARGLGPVAL